MKYPTSPYRIAAMTLLATAIGTAMPAFAAAGQTIRVADIGLSTPESIEYDAAGDTYLVSNINGDPFAADGNGFISKIGPDGKVIDLKWIESGKNGAVLNAPKGIAIVGKQLFVVDIDQVRVFALPSGKPLKSFAIEGSTFLNGITPGPNGSVYLTDSGLGPGFKETGTDAVYQAWSNGKYSAIVKDAKLGRPNGLIKDGNRLIVVTFGTGKALSVDMNGQWKEMASPEKGGLDGMLKLKDGRFLTSSWGGSALYTFDQKGKTLTLSESLDSPADIGFDSKRNRILVPLFKQNALAFVPL